MIKVLEERSMHAWPALHTVNLDGWLLRFADGYSKRANSVIPSTSNIKIDMIPMIERCERFYLEHQQDVIFKIVPGLHGSEIGHILADRGYVWTDEVSLQTADLTMIEKEISAQVDVQTSNHVDRTWIAEFCRLSSQSNPNAPDIIQRMLHTIVLETCYCTWRHEDEVVACGFAVREQDTVGLFDIVTNMNYRRMGFGKSLVRHLMQWGKKRGADLAYLQVVAANQPAIQLYHQLGFREHHRHGYWVRSRSTFL